MKKIVSILLTMSLLASMLILTAAPVSSASVEYPLYAGQNILVGHVEVYNDADNIFVTFVVDAPWELVEGKVAIGTDPTDIPQTKKGNPIPGQFPYSGNPVVIPNEWDPEDSLVIATHATVRKIVEDGYTETITLVSGAGSDNVLLLAEGTSGYPVGYTGPFQEYSGESVLSALAWTHEAWTPYSIAGADWISSAEFAENPLVNTWRLFTRSFEIPANAENISGTLKMNSDNAEEVYINGTFVGDGYPAFVYGSPSPPTGPAHGWSSVEQWDVTGKLNPGTNELWTMTRNYGWAGGPEANPTALIYSLEYSFDVPPVYQTETAWGGEEEFAGANWAKYFEYDLQWSLVQKFEVSATGTIAESNTLENGNTYKIVVEGTYRFVNWDGAGIADALYSLRIPGSYNDTGSIAWIAGQVLPSPWTNYLEIWEGEPLAPLTGWYNTSFNESHVYEFELTGDGSALLFKIMDNAYGDNSGALTISIYE